MWGIRHLMATEMTFSSLNSFHVNGNRVFIIENPRDCVRFDWLIGQLVEIDGLQYRVKKVDCPMTATHRAGQPIAVSVEAI